MAIQRLVADIGGTNARFALSINGELDLNSLRQFACADYTSLYSAVDTYRKQIGLADRLTEAVLAVAGPVQDGEVAMTNQSWSFSEQQVQHLLAIDAVRIINDFEAIAWSLPALSTDDSITLGKPSLRADRTQTVIGPGTGMGVALCIPSASGYLCQATEGGHAGLAPGNALEAAIFAYYLEHGEQISREWFLSGNGLRRLYRALAEINDQALEDDTPAAIQARATSGKEALAVSTLNVFCGLLGSAAADQALSCGATGGVYIAGGIVPRFIDFLLDSPFRARFEQKPPMNDLVRNIGTAVIVHPHPGLLGCASYHGLEQPG